MAWEGWGPPYQFISLQQVWGHLVLVDFDKVDISNLQRQVVHMTDDIGRLKVDSASEHLLKLNPETKVSVIDHALEDEELINEVSLATVVVDATDNFQSRFIINSACVKTKTPLVFAAAIRFEAQVSVFDQNKPGSPCYRCLYDEDANIDETCTANGVLAPLLGLTGSIQATETMKLIMDLGDTLIGKLLLIDAMRMEFHTAKLKKDPDCPVCSVINN